MSGQKPRDSSSSTSSARPPPECFFCGRRDSGEWHYAATLGGVVCEECYRRAMTPPPNTPAVMLLLPRLPADRSCPKGVGRLSRVPDAGMHAADGFRGLCGDSAAKNRRSHFGPLTGCARRTSRRSTHLSEDSPFFVFIETISLVAHGLRPHMRMKRGDEQGIIEAPWPAQRLIRHWCNEPVR
jgi:hypothetical protein